MPKVDYVADSYQKSLNLMENQPLYPFIEVQIGGVTLTDFTDEMSDTLMQFVCTRQGVAQTNYSGDKFELTLYDDTAVEIERVLYSGMQMAASVDTSGESGEDLSSSESLGDSDGSGGGNTYIGLDKSKWNDPSYVKTMYYSATMKKSAGKYKKGEKVTLCRTLSGKWVINGDLKVKDNNNAGWSKYFNMHKQIYDGNHKYSKATAEAWINSTGIGSNTNWLLWANKYCQKVYIFKGSKGNWVLQKTYKAGTGSYGNSVGSDNGVYTKKKLYDKHMVYHYGNFTMYYFQHYTSKWGSGVHSGGKGRPSTHGCIAIQNKGAKWVFETLPINSRVVMY